MPRWWLVLALAAAPARAEAPAGQAVRVEGGVTEPGVRKSAFSIGIAGRRHSLKSGDNEVIGNAGAVQLGTGYISESWYAAFSFDILLGPYEPSRGSQLNVDYSGTGGTLWAGFSAQTMNLRSAEGGYGFALGLSYADIVGRSVGKNRRENDDDPSGSPGLIENYIMRVNDLSLLPALFFSWLAPPRPRGNTPELLTTRLEGYFLTLGMAMPLVSTYSARYTVRPGPGEATQPNKVEKGELRGYSIMMSLTAMLGT